MARGDLDFANTETCTFYGEDGNQLGNTVGDNGNTSYAGNTTTATISLSTFNRWRSDGAIEIEAEFGAGVNITAGNYTCQGNFVNGNGQVDGEAKFSVNYPISYQTSTGQTGATFNIVGKDTIFINNPSTYRLVANPTSLSSQYSKNWYVNGRLLKQGGSTGTTFTRIFNNADTLSAVVADCNGSTDTVSRVVYVDTPNGCPNTEFVASSYKTTILTNVDLNDLSTNGPTSWQWDISQVNPPNPTRGYIYTNARGSQGQNPSVQFFRPGVYDVSLTAFNLPCPAGKKETKKTYIEVLEAQNVCSDQSSTDTTGILVDNGGADGAYTRVNGQACTYSISPCATKVDLNLTELDLRDNRAFLRIYDGNSADGKPLWNTTKFGSRGLTGDLSQAGISGNYTATSGNVYVEFSTGADPSGSGFSLNWESENTGLDPLRSQVIGDSINCGGFNTTFEADANFDNNVTYEWYFDSTFNEEAQGNASVYNYEVDSVAGLDTAGLVVGHCGRFDTTEEVFRGIQPANPPDVDFEASQTFGQAGATITLTDQSEPCVRDREWIISPNTFSFVNNTGRKSASADVQFNAEGSYTVTLVDSNAGGTADTTKFGLIQIQEYCQPTVNSRKKDLGMNFVSIANLNQASSVGNNDYSNFNRSAVTPKLEQGATYELEAARNLALNTVNYKVWVDFNVNGQFEPNEVFAQSGPIGGNSWTDSVTIAKNRPTGTYQMRIGANFGSFANNPCGNTYGEYEDYLIDIIPDTTSPEIRFTGNDTLGIPACSDPSLINQAAFALDNVDGRVDDISYMGNVDTARPGAYNVTYTYTDTAGNVAERDRIIEVLPDNNDPMFQLNGDQFVTISVDQNFTDPGTTQPTDPCTGIDTFITQSFVDQSTLGVDSIVYTARDRSGNQLQRKRFVELIDTTAPSFDLAGPNPLVLAVSDNYQDPGVQNISDNFWGQNDISVSTDVQVNDAVLGEYQVIYRVGDGSGNVRQRTRIVEVQDQTPPQITKVADTVQVPVYTVLDFNNALNVVDNNSPVTLVDTLGIYDQQFPNMEATVLGTYTLTLVYEDQAGNQNSADLAIQVVDNEAPSISLKGPTYLRFDRYSTTPYASADSVTVNDNYYRDFQVTVDTGGSYFTDYVNDSLPSGVFEVTYQAEDPSGNISREVTRVVEAVTAATGLDAQESDQSILVYPNPATDRARVEVSFENRQNYRVQLVNTLGETVQEVSVDEGLGNQYTLQLEGLAKGAYVVRVTTGDSIYTQEIIVQ